MEAFEKREHSASDISLDLDVDLEMPETPSSRSKHHKVIAPKTRSRQVRGKAHTHDGATTARNHQHHPKSSKLHKNSDATTKKETERVDHEDHLHNDLDTSDSEEKLCACLEETLVECSRQRLRALHMTLRHHGNVDNRISVKDMHVSLQETQVRLSARALQMLTEICVDHQGVDYEKMYHCLEKAHVRTGRDSIKARAKRNDLMRKDARSNDAIDEDFFHRLEELLVRDETFFDLDMLRTEFSKWDQHRLGKMDKEGALLICSERTPLYGALLKNLLNRCDEDKDGKISWPLLLNFLEKAQHRVKEKYPELSVRCQSAKENVRIKHPDPVDSLSASTRSKLLDRLLKKTNERRVGSAESRASSSMSTCSDLNPGHESPKKQDQGTDRQPKKETEKMDEMNEKKGHDKEKQSSQIVKDNSQQSKSNDEGKDYSHDDTTLHYDDERKAGGQNEETGDHEKFQRIPANKVKVVVPRDFRQQQVSLDPPEERLQLDWVYGYRGTDCNQNLNLISTGEIIYFVATIVILHKPDVQPQQDDETDDQTNDQQDETELKQRPSCLAGSQRHYREHTAAIRCLSVHSDGVIVASGQKSRDERNPAHVRIWRSDTLQTLQVLGEGQITHMVVALAFMPGKDVVVTVDNGREKKLTVWASDAGTQLAETYLSVDTICDVGFSPKSPDILVTCGKEHLAWWRVNLATGSIQHYMQPNYETFLKARYVLCLHHTHKGDLITGDSNGTVYVWGAGGNGITNFVKHGHDGPVLSVVYSSYHLYTGGKDGAMKVWRWNKNMDLVGHLQLPRCEGGMRTILLNSKIGFKRTHLFMGSTLDSIRHVTLASHGSPLDDVKLDDLPLVQGMTQDIHALSCLGAGQAGDIIVVSADGCLCQLETSSKLPVWRYNVQHRVISVDSSQNGLLVIGSRTGHLCIFQLKANTGEIQEVFSAKVSSKAIHCVKIAPSERQVAVAGSDVAIFALRAKDTEEEWQFIGHCKGHMGTVQAVDWSTQEDFLRTSSNLPQQKFWQVSTLTEVNGRDLNDIKWATGNCILDHALLGVWRSKQASDGHVNCVDISPSNHLVAMANNHGTLSLFRYPSYQEGAFSHAYKSHEDTPSLRFSPNGRSLLTVGGTDTCIMQWKLV